MVLALSLFASAGEGCGKGLNLSAGAGNDSAPAESPSPAPVPPRPILLSGLSASGSSVLVDFDVAIDIASVTPADFDLVYTDTAGGQQVTSVLNIGAWSNGNTRVLLNLKNFLPATGTFYLSLAVGSISDTLGATNSAGVIIHATY